MTNPQAEMRQQLMNALYHDDLTTVEELLKQGVNVNLPYNHNGWTPFMWVCKEHCNPKIIELFLEHGAKLDRANNEGSTPLHIMAHYRSSFDCLELLIENGANPDAQDSDGWTPLMNAVYHPQVSMRMEVVYGLLFLTNLAIKNNKGETAYDLAKSNPAFEDKDCLEMLKKGAENE
ncbi:ankyrin repeat domain-containing protein [bacterium]|nr:ankyrin repeat domain-containing protein [bacterium]